MDLCRERIRTAYNRAVRSRGGVVDHDCPKFRAALSDELKKLAVEDLLGASSDVQRVGVDHDGVIVWEPIAVAV